MMQDMGKTSSVCDLPMIHDYKLICDFEIAPRSCVIKIIAVSCSFLIRTNSSRISYWVIESIAVVGSSAIRSAGFNAIAIPIMILCSIPPDSLMRIFLKNFFRISDLHPGKCFHCSLLDFFCFPVRMRCKCFPNLISDPVKRIKAGHRILKHYGNLTSADPFLRNSSAFTF